MNVVRIELARGLGRHLRAGHPWVFRKALEQVPRVPAGSVVDLTEGGKFVARGYFDPHSAIAVRVLTRDPRENIDAAFIARRVKQALAERRSLIDLTDTDSFRLLHGEGDGLPGVVADLYAGYVVLKLYSAGLTPYRHLIVEALKAAVPELKGVLGRDEVARDDVEEDEGRGSGKMLHGATVPDLISIRERGYFDPHSAIAVRVLTRDPRENIDAAFIARRVKQALAERRALIDLTDTDSFRLLHGEGDGLPGVVADLYAGYVVLKLYSAGLTPYRHLIVEALKAAVPELKGVLGRDEVARDDVEEDEGRGSGKMLHGATVPDLIPIRERGATFLVDAWRGQKTGFFLDQRENRFLIRRLAKDRDVLNCFCFSGGFSVNAALGGAKSVFSVDLDPDAIALARENFTRNGLPAEKHDFLAADAFKIIQSFKDEGRTFDLIILDPPAFAKSQRAVQAAIDGYASLNRQALALLRPGGFLATASCSARVSPDDFMGAVREAGFKAGVDLALVEERYQPPDHPVRLQFPEGKYLKFYVLASV